MFGEVSPGYRRPPEQRTTDGSLSAAGQLYTCSAAQPQPQDELGGMFDSKYYANYHNIMIYTLIYI